MTEHEIIDRAYEKTVEEMAMVFFMAMMIDDQNYHAGAERRFQNGLKVAAFARDRAKVLSVNRKVT